MSSDKIRKTRERAQSIIATFLKRDNPKWPLEECQKSAAAIISHLASANPPLLICTPDEMKE